ncbi:MAG: protein kinase [Pseudomonadota bacterium]|nr:protein kinase [Pseudomonadota bacterium]
MSGPLIPGRLIERYRVEELIGEGGTAAVYRVRHVHLGTEHALKVMTLLGSQAAPRLLLEGRVQAGLRHPNVVTVFDVLEVDGSFGLLMEYVPAPSLCVWISRNPPRVDLAEALFRGIVEGVRHAHAHGLVHRDLKPANVLLARADPAIVPGGLIPKVADFGLARLLDSDGHRHTRSGLAMGTPQYMAPEQFRDAKGVDRRADLFSLGCILHELLSGAPAFPWTDLIGVYTAMAGSAWAPLPPGVPDRLRAAIAGCLDPNPDTRIPDCGSLLALLDGAGPSRGPTLVPTAAVLAQLQRGAVPQDAPTVFLTTPIAGIPTPLDTEPAGVAHAHPTLAMGQLENDAEGSLFPADVAPMEHRARVVPRELPPAAAQPEPPDTEDFEVPPPVRAERPRAAPPSTLASAAPATRPVVAAPSTPAVPKREPARGAWIAAGALGLVLIALLAWAFGGAPAGPPSGPVGTPPVAELPTPPVVEGVVTPPVIDGGVTPPVVATVVTPPVLPKDRPAGRTPKPGIDTPTAAVRPPITSPPVTTPPVTTPPVTTPAVLPVPVPVSPPTAADTRASVRAVGAQTVWLEDATGKHALPGRVPPGRYQVWADFGAGAVPTNEVSLGPGDDAVLRCNDGFQSCPVH